MGDCGIVYKISCIDYIATNVGQTKRKFKKRIDEHRADVRWNFKISVINNHKIDNNHTINWNNIEILDHKKSYKKRLISQMLIIKRQGNGINKQSDTDLLADTYSTIIRNMSNV